MTEKMHLVFGLVAALPEGEKSAAFDELAAWMREHDSVDIERKALPT